MKISAYFLFAGMIALTTLGGCTGQRNNDGTAAGDTAAATGAQASGSTAPQPAATTSVDTAAASAGSDATAKAAPGDAAATTNADGSVFVSRVQRVDGQIAGGDKPVAPNFTWKDAKGVERSLSDYRGKVVLVNFWGTWCPPCRAELPDIVRLRDELAPKGFEVIGLNVGEERRGGSPEQTVATFAKANNLRYPLMLAQDNLISAYGGLDGVPTTFILNGQGQIVQKMVGMQSEGQFREAIQKAM